MTFEHNQPVRKSRRGQPTGGIAMRALLLPLLFGFGFGLIGTADASSVSGPDTIHREVTNFLPGVQLATHQCRAETVCDDNGKNCHTVDRCH